MHKVVILKLARSYVKDNPFLIPPNGLKYDIIIECESNAQTKLAAGDQQKGGDATAESNSDHQAPLNRGSAWLQQSSKADSKEREA
jgi:hypothetical protein